MILDADFEPTLISPYVKQITKRRNGMFLCHEMAISMLRKHQPYLTKTSFFGAPTPISGLTEKHRSTIRFNVTKTHRMTWEPRITEIPLLPQCFVEAVMKQWYETLKSISRKPCPIVAFVGGHLELDLLTAMSIPSANLHDYNCPKVDVVVSQFPKVVHTNYICSPQNHASLSMAGSNTFCGVCCPSLQPKSIIK
jgi:hypothetical protein